MLYSLTMHAKGNDACPLLECRYEIILPIHTYDLVEQLKRFGQLIIHIIMTLQKRISGEVRE
jgi:hypothetical protein